MYLPWEPAVYEHKAALLGCTVTEVANSAERLTAALLAEYDTYRADYLTVGVDVYNVEAEACGARILDTGPEACPEIPVPLWDLTSLPARLPLPEVPAAGRFRLMLEAGLAVSARLAGKIRVRVAASGPLSLAAKLVGFEPLLLALHDADPAAERLLEFATALTARWCTCLREHGLDVVLFDSMASPPMLSPALYAAAVLPLHRRLLRQLAASGQAERPLLMGGNTVPLISCLKDSGATMLVCDFPAAADAFAAALGEERQRLLVRRNVTPALFAAAVTPEVREVAAQQLAADLHLFPRPIAGTGILPYRTDTATVTHFRDTVRTVFEAGNSTG